MSSYHLMTTSLYPPLPTHGNHIRLLCVHGTESSRLPNCSLIYGNLDQGVQYDALSYTWGSPHQNQHILVNGKLMEVRQNLYDFLCHIRQENTDCLVWADAVCINQSSNEEKNQQVKKMHLIFEKARQVLVWLESGLFDEQTMALLRVMADPSKVDYAFSQGLRTYTFAMQKMLQLFYWNRTWIIQEFILAKQVYLLYGDVRIYEPDFYESWVAIKAYLGKISTGPGTLSVSFQQQDRDEAAGCLQSMNESNLDRLTEYRSGWGSHAVVGFKFYDLIVDFQHTECTDRRDKVYALLSLVEDHDPWKDFQIDYDVGPVSLLYRALAMSDAPCDMTDRTVWSGILGVSPEEAFLTTRHLRAPLYSKSLSIPIASPFIQAHLAYQGHIVSLGHTMAADSREQEYMMKVALDHMGKYCSKYVSGTLCRRGDLVFDIAQAHVYIVADGQPSDIGPPRIKGIAFAAQELHRYTSSRQRSDMFRGASRFGGMRLKQTDKEYYVELDTELWDMIAAYHMQRLRTEKEIQLLQARGFISTLLKPLS